MLTSPSFSRVPGVPVVLLGLTVALWCVHAADAYEVGLDFSVQAESEATEFRDASVLLQLDPPKPFSTACVSVTYTLTDFDGDGASLTGLGPNGGAFLAQYNGWAGHPLGPQGTTFAECIFSMTAGPYETVTTTFETWDVILETIEDISVLYWFELSATDIAVGSGVFALIPEPGSLALLIVIGLAATMRRIRCRS